MAIHITCKVTKNLQLFFFFFQLLLQHIVSKTFMILTKFLDHTIININKILPRSLKDLAKIMQDLFKIIERPCQNHGKILPRSLKDLVKIMKRSCQDPV